MLMKFTVICCSALWESPAIALVAVLSKADKVVFTQCEFCHEIIRLLHIALHDFMMRDMFEVLVLI